MRRVASYPMSPLVSFVRVRFAFAYLIAWRIFRFGTAGVVGLWGMARQLIETHGGQHLVVDLAASPKTRSEFLAESPWTYPNTATFDIATVAMFAMSPIDLACFPATAGGLYTVIR